MRPTVPFRSAAVLQRRCSRRSTADASAGVETLLATYLRQKKLIQNILAQKYGAGLLERDGGVIVHLADLSAQAAVDPIGARLSPFTPRCRGCPSLTPG